MRRKTRKRVRRKAINRQKKFLKKRKIKIQEGKGWFSKNANLIKRIFGG